MQDDFFGLLVFLAFIALAWLKQRRSQTGAEDALPAQTPLPLPDVEAESESERPSALSEQAWGRNGQADTAPDRRQREAASAKRLGERTPAPKRNGAMRPPQPPRPSRPHQVLSARQAMVALAVYGPCRADQPYPASAWDDPPPNPLFNGRQGPRAAAPPSPPPNRPARR